MRALLPPIHSSKVVAQKRKKHSTSDDPGARANLNHKMTGIRDEYLCWVNRFLILYQVSNKSRNLLYDNMSIPKYKPYFLLSLVL